MRIMLIPDQAMQFAAGGVAFDIAQVLALIIGTVLPLVAGLITRWGASAGTRAIVLLVLAAITSFLTELQSAVTGGTAFDVGATLLAVLGTFLVGVGSHFGLWRAVGASNAVKNIGGFIGGSSRSATERDGSF